MAYYFINVKLRDKSTVTSPQINDQAEAQAQLGKLRDVIGTGDDAGLDWIAVMGADILSASIEEQHPREMPRIR